MKSFARYLMALLYAAAGILHFVVPEFYLKIMPSWMPVPSLLVYLSGVIEFALGLLLLFPNTKKLSAWLIIFMLVVFFFAIHIPQAIDYGRTNNPHFWITLVRLPIQFLLIAWAYGYTRTLPQSEKR